MYSSKKILCGLAAALGLLVLILDTKTGVVGASEGIQLCLYSVIPTLLPFCVLSKLINTYLLGEKLPLLRPLGKLCGIPEGAEAVLLSGFLGGYPVGAQEINSAYKVGSLSLNDARRMLGFCSNAGPAFVFGILGCQFSNKLAVWCLWGIHILSALVVGLMLPRNTAAICKLAKSPPAKVAKIVEDSVKSMAMVSTWVILFRMILHFLQRWFFWLLPQTIQIAISGALELANGCVSLSAIQGNGLRFLLASAFLAFGGICVTMQTLSVTKDVGIGIYFVGKLLQTGISLLLAGLIQYLIFPIKECCNIPVYYFACFGGILIGIIIFIRSKKKVVAFAR